MSDIVERAEAEIRDEKCFLHHEEGQPWCSTHDGWWPNEEPYCRKRPALVDVAADLLARVKAVKELHVSDDEIEGDE